jgi:predicted nucleic acid-binding protein
VILIDTSVVIEYAQGTDAKLVGILPTLPSAICGVTRAEVLCGVRDAKHRATVLTLLSAFHKLPIPDHLWDQIGDEMATLRANGLTIPLSDIVIASLGIHHGIEVWARDRHFPMMKQVLPSLKLFQEPP